MTGADVVIIGSGVNGLVAGAYLARAGWIVEVLERNPEPGGAIATDQLTLPGFVHDTFSSWHPAFLRGRTYADLQDELSDHGLAYGTTELPCASVSRFCATVMYRDRAHTAAGLDSTDATSYLSELARYDHGTDLLGRLMRTELRSARSAYLVARMLYRLRGPRSGLLAQDLTASARTWLEAKFDGAAARELLAPWVLHSGLDLSAAGGAIRLPMMATAMHATGMPLVIGGSRRLVDALSGVISARGGRVQTKRDVERIVIAGGTARGVQCDGETVWARRGVIANTTPTQLYRRLVPKGQAPAIAVDQARRFRYGTGCMMVHLALSRPPRWRHQALAGVAVVHLLDDCDAIQLACEQAGRAFLPARPTIVCGQPTLIDPSRAPAGKAILWLQLPHTPYRPIGDAAGEIDVGTAGWCPQLTDAYADRVTEMLGEHIDGLRDTVISRACVTPEDLERSNINLVRGDAYAGSTELDQSFGLRPLPSFGSHATPIAGLWHCGASTYPGPGMHASSGRIVAEEMLRHQRGFRGAVGRSPE